MKKVVRSFTDILIGMSLLVSCVHGTGSEAFRSPEILSAEAELSWKAATLHCSLSDGRVERCGFIFEDAEEAWTTLPAQLRERTFAVPVDGLEPGRSYRYLAWAEAGDCRISSDTLSFTAREALPEDPIDVEDPVFKDWLLAHHDRNGDGEISFAEAKMVRSVSIAPTNRYNLQSLQGIEYMPNLEVIDCWGDWYDVGEKTSPINSPYYFVGPYRDSWETIWGPIGTLRSLDVRQNPKLRVLAIQNNSALGVVQDTLDISANPLLETLWVGMTWLQYPKLPGHAALRKVNLSHIRGEYPDLRGLPALRELTIDFRQDDLEGEFMDVDVSGCPQLEYLSLSEVAGSLSDLRFNPHLKYLHLAYTGIRKLDVTSLAELEDLDCSNMGLQSLDLSCNPALLTLYCNSNLIRVLDLSHNLRLGSVPGSGLWCPDMRFGTDWDVLETVYVAPGQVIPFVTENRSDEHIPPSASIVVKTE